MAGARHRRRPPSLLRRAAGALVWLVLAALLALGAAIVAVPATMGWVPLTILSGSMEPTIPVGSQVVVDPVEGVEDAKKLQVGDVITFMPEPDDQTVVTHRVIARSVSGGGVYLTTRGDANEDPDQGPVTAQQIRGVVRYHVPYAGYVAQVLTGEQKKIGIVVLAAGLFGYAAVQLICAVRGPRSRTGRGTAGPVGDQGPEVETRRRAGSGRRPGRARW